MQNAGEKPTILVADDEQVYLDVMSRTLKGRYELLYAPDGEKAVDIAIKAQPDLIIMDWDMPHLSGIEAIERLQKERRSKDIPIIMCTGAMTSVSHLEQALKAGAIDFLSKPVDPVELIARISTMLKLSQSYLEIKDQKEKLEELNHEKDSILGIVAHDLRSPLSNISSLIYMLKEFKVEEKERIFFLEKALAEIEHGNTLINDLLMVTKESMGKKTIEKEKVAVREFLTELVMNFTPDADKKSIDLQWKCYPDFELFTDRNSLRRIINNLVSNALKFSHFGGEVRVTAKDENRFSTIIISDKGLGIREAELPNLFKRFAQISNRPTADETSTGLGMAIVKNLCDQLDITITVESQWGKGTSFTMYIPKEGV